MLLHYKRICIRTNVKKTFKRKVKGAEDLGIPLTRYIEQIKENSTSNSGAMNENDLKQEQDRKSLHGL